MPVRIVTDSACDLRGPEISELSIAVVPLSIRFGDDEFIDREELTVEDFYERLNRASELPETSAPSPGRFEQAFRNHLDDGADSVVCINLSAALSATAQSARTAADSMMADVRVVDSKSITAGLGTMVLAAARLAADGADADTIVATVESMIPRTRVFGALDTLDNLKKGGRIGSAQALLGTMLSIKPIIDISTGTVEEASKQRTRRKSLAWLRDKLAGYPEVSNLSIMHGEAPDIDDFMSMLEGSIDHKVERIEKIGPVIGTHGGPRVMGFGLLLPA